MYSTESKAIKRRGYNGAFATAFYLPRVAGWVRDAPISRQNSKTAEGRARRGRGGRKRRELSKGFINLELIREDLARHTDEDSDSTNEESATPNRYSGSSSTPRQIQEVPVLSKRRNGQGQRQPVRYLHAPVTPTAGLLTVSGSDHADQSLFSFFSSASRHRAPCLGLR